MNRAKKLHPSKCNASNVRNTFVYNIDIMAAWNILMKKKTTKLKKWQIPKKTIC